MRYPSFPTRSAVSAPPSSFLAGLFLLLAGLLVTGPALASQCHGDRPGATLLFPQIAVDFDSEEGESTLISISNTASDLVLANVIVWSNCGNPLLVFPLALESQEVRSLDLRRLLVEGRIPGSGPVDTDLFPSCPTELAARQLGEGELATLAARFLGNPDPGDGLCYAAQQASPGLGYLTVDVLNDCSDVSRTPYDAGYFLAGGLGVAGNGNVLTGDFFFVDGSQSSAQGFAAVALQADAERLADEPGASFYGRGDDRLPIGSFYRTRYLRGGGFDGGTDLLLWVHPGDFVDPGPTSPPCDSCLGSAFFAANAELRTEKGEPVDSWSMTLDKMVDRLQVGSEDLPASADFGSLDFSVTINCGICSPPFIGSAQNYVLPVYRAEGRYSAGMRPTSLADPCAGLP